MTILLLLVVEQKPEVGLLTLDQLLSALFLEGYRLCVQLCWLKRRRRRREECRRSAKQSEGNKQAHGEMENGEFLPAPFLLGEVKEVTNLLHNYVDLICLRVFYML